MKAGNLTTWFALGDSFTTGVGDAPARGGWVARTATALAEDGLVGALRNVAVPGVRIDAVHSAQVPQLAGDHLVVSAIAGANDVLAFGLDRAALVARVSELVAVARRHGRLVLVSTCPDFFAHRFGRGTKLSWRVDELNATVWQEAEAAPTQVVVLDTHAVLQDRSLWDDDGVHPGPAGHEALASAALAILRPRVAPLAPYAAHSGPAKG